MSLSEKQKIELNKAILEYLKNNNFNKTFETFKEEVQISDNEISTGDMLEKKWMAVIRLQKKVLELESTIDQIKSQSAFFKSKLPKDNTNSEQIPVAPAKFLLQGHRGIINSIKFNPVYCILASGSEDGSIRIWDYESGKLEKILKGHTGSVNYLSFNSLGTLLSSGSNDTLIKIWSVETYDCIKTLVGHNHSISSIQFLPSGDFLISSSRDKTIRIWELQSGFCVKTLSGHSDWVRSVIPHSLKPIAISCSNDQKILAWNIERTNEQNSIIISEFNEHEHVIECIEIAPENSVPFFKKADYYKKIAPVKDIHELPTVIEEIKLSNEVEKTKIFFASGSRDKTIKIWEISFEKSILTLKGHDNWVKGLKFHPQGLFLFSCSDDKSIRIWNIEKGFCVKYIQDAHSQFVSCVDFNNTYPLFASGSVDMTIKIWECP